jgi:hypothetical protein
MSIVTSLGIDYGFRVRAMTTLSRVGLGLGQGRVRLGLERVS